MQYKINTDIIIIQRKQHGGDTIIMKGMGSYTSFEREIAHLSIDEVNELYFSGKLDEMYDKYEKDNNIGKDKNKQKGEKSR